MPWISARSCARWMRRGALRRRQRRVRTAGGQVRLGESGERVDLERDLVRVAQHPDAFLVERHCGLRIAFPQRELAVDHRSIGGVVLRAGRLPAVDRFDEIRAGGRGVTERMFGVAQHPQRGGQPEAHRSGTAVRISGLQEQPARAPVEPEIAVLVAQVVGDDPLSFGIAGGLEGGQRLLQQAHALRDVRLVERQHVDRVAHAVQIAGAPGERQRPVGGAVALLDAALAAAGGRDTPPCAPFPGRMPRCLEHAGGPCAVPGGQRVGVGPELGFAQAQQRDRFQYGLTRTDGRLHGFLRRRQRVVRASGADFDVRTPIERLRHHRRLLRATRDVEHRLGVGARGIEVAGRDVAFGAQVEEVEPIGRCDAGRGQRGAGEFDRFRVAAGACGGRHVRDVRRAGGGSPGRGRLHSAGRTRRASRFLRFAHRMSFCRRWNARSGRYFRASPRRACPALVYRPLRRRPSPRGAPSPERGRFDSAPNRAVIFRLAPI